MQEIKLVCEGFSSEELYKRLSEEQKINAPLELKNKPEDSRDIDPKVLIALVNVGGTFLGVIISSLVTIWATKFKSKEELSKAKEEAYIEMKGADGTSLKVPANTPPEKIDEYIEKAKQLKAVKSIILIDGD